MPELLADVPDHRVDRIDLRDDPASSGAKLVVVSSRSVNSLLWSLLFVGIFGPGEALAEAGRGPIEALEAVGATWISRPTSGDGPQVKPAVWSIALFPLRPQWTRIRTAGAGGCRRHRHDARLRDEPVPVAEPRSGSRFSPPSSSRRSP